MPKYLAKATMTVDGVRAVKTDKGTGRRAAVTKLIEAAGGKVESFYFAFGQDDVIMIVDAPENTSTVAASLAANSAGLARVSITPLITVEEMDRAVDKAATLPSPAPKH